MYILCELYIYYISLSVYNVVKSLKLTGYFSFPKFYYLFRLFIDLKVVRRLESETSAV